MPDVVALGRTSKIAFRTRRAFPKERRPTSSAATLTHVLSLFKLSRQEPHMTLVNGESVMPSERDGYIMGDGDEVTIISNR